MADFKLQEPSYKMSQVRKIDLEFMNDDDKNAYPQKVAVSENAWHQLKILRKIFKFAEKDADVLFSISSKFNAFSAKISPGTFTYSKKTGLLNEYLQVTRTLPGDFTTIANELIGELYEKVVAPDTILLFDVDLGEPTGFGEVKNGRLHFGFQ